MSGMEVKTKLDKTISINIALNIKISKCWMVSKIELNEVNLYFS